MAAHTGKFLRGVLTMGGWHEETISDKMVERLLLCSDFAQAFHHRAAPCQERLEQLGLG
jgi:hypothetical protein